MVDVGNEHPCRPSLNNMVGMPREKEAQGVTGVPNPAYDRVGDSQERHFGYLRVVQLLNWTVGFSRWVFPPITPGDAQHTAWRDRFRPLLPAHCVSTHARGSKGLLLHGCAASSICKGLQLCANHKPISVHNADGSQQITHLMKARSPLLLGHCWGQSVWHSDYEMNG